MTLANGERTLGEWSGSDATDRLHTTIAAYNETATKQATSMIRLTWAIVALTLVLVVGLAVQITLDVT